MTFGDSHARGYIEYELKQHGMLWTGEWSVRDDSPAHTIRLPCDFHYAVLVVQPWYEHFVSLDMIIFSSWPFSHLCRKEGELKEGWRRLSTLGKYLISEGDLQWGNDQCPKLNVVFLVCWSRSLMNQYFVVCSTHVACLSCREQLNLVCNNFACPVVTSCWTWSGFLNVELEAAPRLLAVSGWIMLVWTNIPLFYMSMILPFKVKFTDHNTYSLQFYICVSS
jgi:hypothetical protein